MTGTGFAALFWLAAGLLWYHFAGYPLLLAILTRFRARPVCRGAIEPSVTVIIAAHNEGSVIGAKLRSVLDSDYPAGRLRVVVVEDGSTDDTVAEVLRVPDERIVLDHQDERRGKMAAINRALTHAMGEILVFSDANALWERETLRHLVSNFADPSVGCVSGRKKLRSKGSDLAANENLYWQYEAWIKTMESALGSTPAAVGELLAVRRELYHLPASNVINDDFQIVVQSVAQGYRAVYDGTAVTVEEGSGSMGEEFGRKSRIAAGRSQVFGQVLRLTPRHPGFVFEFTSHKALRLGVMPLLILAFVSSLGAILLSPQAGTGAAALLRLGSPWGVLAFGAQAAVYLLAGFGAWLDHRGRRFKPASVAYYFVSAQIASLAGLVRSMTGRQTVLWRKVTR